MRGYSPNLRGFIPKGGSGGGSGDNEGWTYIVTSDDFTTTQVTPQVIAPATGNSLQFGPDLDSVYAVQGLLVGSGAAATDGVQFGILWPATVTGAGSGMVANPDALTSILYDLQTQGTSVASRVANNPGAGLGWLCQLYAIFRISGNPLITGFRVSLESDLGGAVTCHAGSWIRYRKMLSF